MKRLFFFAIALVLGFYLLSSFQGCPGNWATYTQLENVHTELRDSIHVVSMKTDRNYQRIDSIYRELLKVQAELRQMHGKLDTLQQGQVLIYSAVKKEQPNTTILDQFFQGIQKVRQSIQNW